MIKGPIALIQEAKSVFSRACSAGTAKQSLSGTPQVVPDAPKNETVLEGVISQVADPEKEGRQFVMLMWTTAERSDLPATPSRHELQRSVGEAVTREMTSFASFHGGKVETTRGSHSITLDL
jgi:hypothetical protein